MLETIKSVHPLAGATRAFFVPALAASAWPFTI